MDPGSQSNRDTVTAKSIGELFQPLVQKAADQVNPTGPEDKNAERKSAVGEMEEVNMALRRLYCDAKGDGDERGKAFRRAREKVAPNLAREARWLVEYDLIVGIADAAAALGADLFRYLGSEHKERRFLSWGD